MRLSGIWRIKQIEEGVIHQGRRPKAEVDGTLEFELSAIVSRIQ